MNMAQIKRISKIRKTLNNAKALLKTGDLVGAELLLQGINAEQLSKQKDIRADFHHILGLLLTGKGEKTQSFRHLLTSLRLLANDAVIENFIKAGISAGLSNQVIDEIKALEKKDLSVNQLVLLAQCYAGIGKTSEALFLAERATKDNENLDGIILQISLLASRHEYKKSKLLIDRALKVAPEDERPYRLLGEHYGRIREWKKCAEVYQTLEEKHSLAPVSLTNYGSSQLGLGNYAKAINLFKAALEQIVINPKVETANYLRPKEKKDLVNCLDYFHTAMENIGVPFFLFAGTALGIYRDGTILNGDKDIDVAVPWKTSRVDLLKALEGFGFVGLALKNTDFPDENYVSPVVHSQTGVSIDIFYTKTTQNHFELGVDYKPPLLWQLTPFKLSKIEYNNKQYLIPDPIERYFEEYYGPEWKTPQSYCVVLRGAALKDPNHPGCLAFGYFKLCALFQSKDYKKAIKYIKQIKEVANEDLFDRLEEIANSKIGLAEVKDKYV